MRYFCFLILIFLYFFSTGQSITNVNSKQDGSTIFIYYDLESPIQVKVEIFCSDNGGESWIGPLVGVNGDVGEGVVPGKQKEIRWMVFKDLSSLVGENVLFRVDGKALKYTTMHDYRDNKDYKTTQIGDQVWMAENLNYEMSGTSCYDNYVDNCKNMGRMYKWKQATKACPAGWHLPSDADWDKLTNTVGGADLAGDRLQNDAKIGFNLVLGGIKGMSGNYSDKGRGTCLWSATDDGGINAYYREFSNSTDRIVRHYYDKTYFLYVRCVKD